MTARVHLHLHASNLAQSRDFYERLFGLPPVKDYPGYVKFLPDFAPVNLALSSGAAHTDTPVALSHFGVQLDSTAEVVEYLTRVQAAGLQVRNEFATNCCHANQDKFWVTDPDGMQWEIYHLNHDIEPPAVRRGLAGRNVTLPLASAADVECCAPGVACGA